jgi:branched-chain amino acid transport system substrate-binding protein
MNRTTSSKALGVEPLGRAAGRSAARGAAVSLAAALLACGGPREPEEVVLGLTGPIGAVPSVREVVRAAELAVGEVNASSRLGRFRLVLDIRDDSGSGAVATAIAQRYVGDPRVVAVVGHATSTALMAAARVYDGRLVALSPTASSPELSGLSPWVFRVISSDEVRGRAVARFLGSLGARRVAVLYQNDTYGRGLADAFRAQFPGTVVSADPLDPRAEDLGPFASFYAHERLDAVFVACFVCGLPLLRELRRLERSLVVVGAETWTRLVAESPLAEGVYLATPFSAEDSGVAVRRFVARYQARFGVAPDHNAALAYDAVRTLAAAIAERGPERREIRSFLAGLRGGRALPGVTGPIGFTAAGDREGGRVVILQARERALRRVGEATP